jgi:formylmethanofuran dehydrogenase subunit C
VATPLGAPSGLFIAALCNQVQANEISLNLHAFTHRWPFLGYRLARGRRLHLDGNAGDFVGALLEGGDVIVTGNVGNYAGVGMKSGLVHVRHSTGKYTGEGMRGGVLRVDGHIGSLGKARKGTMYEGGRQVFPADTPERQTARSAKRG